MKLKKTKIRIGIIVDQLLAGGVQLSAIEQVKTLNRMGHQAKLIILMRKVYRTNFSYLIKEIPHEFLSDRYPKLFRNTFKFPIFSFLSSLHLLSPLLAPRVVKKREYDVLVSMGTTTSITTQAIFKRNKIPYIAVIHDPITYILETSYRETPLRFIFPLLKYIAKKFENSFIHDAKKTIIISRVHFSYLKKNYGIEPVIISIGTSPSTSIPTERGDMLLSFGRWQYKKNPVLLLKLLLQLPDAKLILAGSWTDQKELEEFKKEIKRERLNSRVNLVTHYTPKILSSLCAQARVFLHPHFEAFGLATLEAAGHGVPIIIPKKSGVTEGFTHGIHGFFPNTENVQEYEYYVNKLLLDKKLAYKMGLAAWQQVKSKFSWEATVSRLLEIINQTCDINRKSTIMILETGHTLGTSLAGGDKLMEPMARRLTKEFSFSVIVPKIGAQHWQKTSIPKKIFALPLNAFDRKGAPVPVFLTYCVRMWQTLRTIYRESHTFDLLYSSTNILPDVLPGAIAKTFIPTFWVARIHHLIPPPQKREGRWVVNVVSYFMQHIALALIKSQADLIIALNEELKQELSNRKFPISRIETVGAGIDYNRISAYICPEETKAYTGIYLGRLHPAKGIFDLVPIWEKVVSEIPNATLAIIGAGEPRVVRQLKHLIEAANLTRQISLLGVIPETEVYCLMKKAKVFLFTDHESGWGLAVAEAMACGLPVVGYDTGILETIYKDGFRVVPLSDSTQFAREILSLLRSEDHRLELVKRALQTAAKLDWKVATDAFREALLKHFTPRLL